MPCIINQYAIGWSGFARELDEATFDAAARRLPVNQHFDVVGFESISFHQHLSDALRIGYRSA